MLKAVRKRHTSLERQRQIVDAARRLIIKYGSEHITVRRIAREIGISEGAIYRHFRSKKDILFLLIGVIEDNLMADMERSRLPGKSPLEVLDDIVRNNSSTIQQRKGVNFLVIAEIISLGDKTLNRKISAVISRYTGLIREILAEGVKSGEIRPDLDVDTMATLFFGMIQGMVNIWALGEYKFDLLEKNLSAWRILREAVASRISPVAARL